MIALLNQARRPQASALGFLKSLLCERQYVYVCVCVCNQWP